jgi:hypothetical protein
MMQSDSDKTAALRTPEQVHAGRVAIGVLVAVWLVPNLYVVSLTASDLDGFHAMGTVVVGAVFVNSISIIFIGSLILVGRVSRAAGNQAVPWFVAAAVLLPLAASVGDFFLAAWLRH